MLGHFNFRPSSQRIYKSSAIGDLREGDSWAGNPGVIPMDPVGLVDDDGRPDISSSSSVTTRPLDVISLLRVIRL